MQPRETAWRVHAREGRSTHHERQNQAIKPHPRAARPPHQRQVSQPTKPPPRAPPASSEKPGDTNSDKEVNRAQQLSPTAVYPTRRRAPRHHKTSLASASCSDTLLYVRSRKFMTSVEQQIANLKPCVKSGIARRFHVYLFAGGILLIILSIVLWHPIPLMLAAFFGLVALGSRESGPLLETAIQAYETVEPVAKEVTILIESDGDSDRYYATVIADKEAAWRYEFIPQGWNPVAGTHAALIWTLPSSTSPNLISVPEGIMIPRYKPKLLQPNQIANRVEVTGLRLSPLPHHPACGSAPGGSNQTNS